MALASTSSAQLTYIEESTYGETPVVGDQVALRMTGESLAYDITREESKEINSTRQVSGSAQTAASLAGGINIELSYREYDPFFEALFSSTFTSFGTDGVKSAVALTFAGQVVTAPAATFTGLSEGQWISLTGIAPTTDNTGFYRIATWTSDTEITLDAATPLADAIGADYSISHSELAVGVEALRSFSIERQLTDVSQFFTNRGMAMTKLDLSFDTGAIVGGSFNCLGKDTVRASATAMPGTTVDSQAYGMINAVSGIGHILVDNTTALLGTSVKSMNVSIDGKARGLTAIGTLGNIGVATGTFTIGGTLELYLEDGDVYDKAISDTYVSIQFPVYDTAGNGYVFVFDNCKLGVPQITAGAKDQDVMMSVTFAAEAPSGSDKMVKIYRCGVVAV